MAMAGELQISFQHPGFTLTFKEVKHLSPASDSCKNNPAHFAVAYAIFFFFNI